MTRTELDRFLREVYDARLSNDAECCLAYFAPGARLHIAGAADNPITGTSESSEALRRQLTELVDAWEWKAVDIRALLVDGDRAAVHYRLTAVYRPTNETVTTEVLDLVTVADGKVVDVTQFFDTAELGQVVARGGV